MDIEQVRDLSDEDQRVFLLGRVASETTRMDAALRMLHAALRGEHSVDAFLDAPNFVSTLVKECRSLLSAYGELDEGALRAVRRTLTDASAAYSRRNRFMHDMLRADLLTREWQLAGLVRRADGEQPVEPTRFDNMVGLVCDLVGVTWRVRGAAFYVHNRSWQGSALGAVTGQWDGSAEYLG